MIELTLSYYSLLKLPILVLCMFLVFLYVLYLLFAALCVLMNEWMNELAYEHEGRLQKWKKLQFNTAFINAVFFTQKSELPAELYQFS